MKTKILKVLFILITFFIGCTNETPITSDGGGKLVLYALWDSSSVENVKEIIPLSNASVVVVSEYGTMLSTTDKYGFLELTDLPAARYDAAVRMRHPVDNKIVLSGTRNSLIVETGKTVYDTVFVIPYNIHGICINEVYSFGAQGTQFYYYDQFIELYNSSDSIKYLDGMQIIRVSENLNSGAGGDWDNDDDIDGVTYIFKFPGKPGEKNYPFLPYKFLVLASSAVDHSLANSKSVNLRNADWEFYNQYSPTDSDHPDVKNLINLHTDKTADFYTRLDNDIIILTTGEDTDWIDGIDISTVIDGVEYQISNLKRKTLDSRVDKSYVLTPSKYSGRSIQRREPGLDTNDGILDWEITSAPSPGY